ncbi:MAG: BrnT family toxin [Acidiferrobacteraceae bacterium]
MRYSWDEDKRTANERKHGVEFADAVSVLDDLLALTIEDRDHDEQRFVTLGMDAFGRLLVVVYTYPEPDIIASSRRGKRNPTNTVSIRSKS